MEYLKKLESLDDFALREFYDPSDKIFPIVCLDDPKLSFILAYSELSLETKNIFDLLNDIKAYFLSKSIKCYYLSCYQFPELPIFSDENLGYYLDFLPIYYKLGCSEITISLYLHKCSFLQVNFPFDKNISELKNHILKKIQVVSKIEIHNNKADALDQKISSNTINIYLDPLKTILLKENMKIGDLRNNIDFVIKKYKSQPELKLYLEFLDKKKFAIYEKIGNNWSLFYKVFSATPKKLKIIHDFNFTVNQLKDAIQEQERIPKEQQIIIYNGKNLADEKSLTEYGIINCVLFHVALNLKGGGIVTGNFVDLEQAEQQKIDFCLKAPNWRICKKGINITGYCRNKECKAFNQIVICPLGKVVIFDLILNSHSVKCPECNRNFVPESCGFVNCYYSWAGKKIENNQVKNFKLQKWENAGNNFLYFSPIKNKNVIWINLRILVLFSNDNHLPNSKVCDEKININSPLISKCGICKDQILTSNYQSLDCSHEYHSLCLQKLSFSSTKKNKISCVLCSY